MRRNLSVTRELEQQRTQARQALLASHAYVRLFCRQQLLLLATYAAATKPHQASPSLHAAVTAPTTPRKHRPGAIRRPTSLWPRAA